MKFTDEPVVWIGFVKLVIGAAVAFGLSWTPEQLGALFITMEGVSTLFVRSQVTPVGTLK